MRRKRNRQSEAETRGDVGERWSIVAEIVQKLPEKRCNFDASRVYKLATIISDKRRNRKGETLDASNAKCKYDALNMFTGYQRQSIIESDFYERILCRQCFII